MWYDYINFSKLFEWVLLFAIKLKKKQSVGKLTGFIENIAADS